MRRGVEETSALFGPGSDFGWWQQYTRETNAIGLATLHVNSPRMKTANLAARPSMIASHSPRRPLSPRMVMPPQMMQPRSALFTPRFFPIMDKEKKEKSEWDTVSDEVAAKRQAAAAAKEQAKMAAAAAEHTTYSHMDELTKKRELRKALSLAEEGLNSRHKDMFKAFRQLDLDNSGRLSKSEMKRALSIWNVELDGASLDLMYDSLDKDKDGGVSYEEFVDSLARGTVSMAAMGKRGMQSGEAMGVDAQEMLKLQMGHGGVPKHA